MRKVGSKKQQFPYKTMKKRNRDNRTHTDGAEEKPNSNSASETSRTLDRNKRNSELLTKVFYYSIITALALATVNSYFLPELDIDPWLERLSHIGNASQILMFLLSAISVYFLYKTLKQQNINLETQTKQLALSQAGAKRKEHAEVRKEILQYISEAQAEKRSFIFTYDDETPYTPPCLDTNEERDSSDTADSTTTGGTTKEGPEGGTKETDGDTDEKNSPTDADSIVTEDITESFTDPAGCRHKNKKTVTKYIYQTNGCTEEGRDKTFRGHQIFDCMYVDLVEISVLLAAKTCNSEYHLLKALSSRLKNRLNSYGDMCDIVLPLAMKYRYITKKIEESTVLTPAEKIELEDLLTDSMSRNELRILGYIYSREEITTTKWMTTHSQAKENEKNLERSYEIYFRDGSNHDLLDCHLGNVPSKETHAMISQQLILHFKKKSNFLLEDIRFFCKLSDTSDKGQNTGN